MPESTGPRVEPTSPCNCGHSPAAHEHWRPGTDCGVCGEQLCPEFVPAGHRPPVSPQLRARLVDLALGGLLLAFVIGAVVIGGADVVSVVVGLGLALIGVVALVWLFRGGGPPDKEA